MKINYEALQRRLADSCEGFGLLTMQATSTTGRLKRLFPDRLRALFSAEHGFFGDVAAGVKTSSAWHPFWNCPIHSLYSEHRKPTKEMLDGIDLMVIDLCDIGVRCYTYLATLKNTLEACAEAGIGVIVLDRPLPLGGVLDGPMRKPEFSSFVAPLNVPFCHAMTPGECAVWIKENEGLDVQLEVVKLLDWSHESKEPWPNFVPPSPAIRSWDSALMYPMTVFTEAYQSIDCDRFGALSFRIIGAPWMNQQALIKDLRPGLASCGVEMRPYRYMPADGKYRNVALDGILFSVGNPSAFYPVTAGVLILTALIQRHGEKVLVGGRDEWFDKLTGSTMIRDALAAGDLSSMFQSWIDAQDLYIKTKVNLY